MTLNSRDKILELWSQGISAGDIAKNLGISEGYVQDVARRACLIGDPRAEPENRRRRRIEMKKQQSPAVISRSEKILSEAKFAPDLPSNFEENGRVIIAYGYPPLGRSALFERQQSRVEVAGRSSISAQNKRGDL